MKDFFASCGKATSVELPMDADGRSTGTAFVKFAKREELEKALELDGQYWPGTERWLKIQEGTEKPERKSFGTGVKPEGYASPLAHTCVPRNKIANITQSSLTGAILSLSAT